MLVRIGPFRQFQAVRDDLRRLGAVVMDQLRKPAVIGFDVGLPGAYLLALEPERAEIEGHFAFLRQFIFRARILRNKHPDDADATRGLGGSYQVVHRQVIGLMAVIVTALVPHTLTTSISAFAVSQVEDLINASFSRELIGVAPICAANFNRSGWLSTTNTCEAPLIIAA